MSANFSRRCRSGPLFAVCLLPSGPSPYSLVVGRTPLTPHVTPLRGFHYCTFRPVTALQHDMKLSPCRSPSGRASETRSH